MAACRACLTPRPRVPPARPDSSAACCWLLPRSVGGWGFPPDWLCRSCCFALIGRLLPRPFLPLFAITPLRRRGRRLRRGWRVEVL